LLLEGLAVQHEQRTTPTVLVEVRQAVAHSVRFYRPLAAMAVAAEVLLQDLEGRRTITILNSHRSGR